MQWFHKLTRVSLSHLLPTSLPLIECANKRYDAIMQKDIDDDDPMSEDLGRDYYMSAEQIKPIKHGSFAESILRSKFSYFSCLSNFLDDTITLKSRYLGRFNKGRK